MSDRDEWKLGLDASSIDDHSYPEVGVGDVLECAVECYFETNPDVARESQRLTEHLSRSLYDISAEVVAGTDDRAGVWVLDCGGLSVFARFGPGGPPFQIGDLVHGRGRLNADPFRSYTNRLNSRSDMPALLYRWSVNAITLDTTPWLQDGSRLSRDETCRSERDVPRTDTAKDDEVCAAYVLTCSRLDATPRRRPSAP